MQPNGFYDYNHDNWPSNHDFIEINGNYSFTLCTNMVYFFIFPNKNSNKQWTHMLCVKLNTSNLRKQSCRIFSIIFWVVLLLLIALFTFGLFGWESSRIWKFYNFFLFFLLWKIIFDFYNKENGRYKICKKFDFCKFLDKYKLRADSCKR